MIITYIYFGIKNKKTTFDDIETHYFDRFKVVTFGKYDQDGDEENGMEPIDWYVIDEKDDNALIISKDTLITIFFHDKDNIKINWENSLLRIFLNYMFYKESFTKNEQGYILSTKVVNNKMNKYNLSLGKDTYDYIYILDKEELKKYFRSDNERMAKGNKHGKILGLTLYSTLPTDENPVEDATYYWVRNAGYREDEVLCVNWDGKINEYGYNVLTNGIGVRPCMWVKKELIDELSKTTN